MVVIGDRQTSCQPKPYQFVHDKHHSSVPREWPVKHEKQIAFFSVTHVSTSPILVVFLLSDMWRFSMTNATIAHVVNPLKILIFFAWKDAPHLLQNS